MDKKITSKSGDNTDYIKDDKRSLKKDDMYMENEISQDKQEDETHKKKDHFRKTYETMEFYEKHYLEKHLGKTKQQQDEEEEARKKRNLFGKTYEAFNFL
jgi:hypothetical protein